MGSRRAFPNRLIRIANKDGGTNAEERRKTTKRAEVLRRGEGIQNTRRGFAFGGSRKASSSRRKSRECGHMCKEVCELEGECGGSMLWWFLFSQWGLRQGRHLKVKEEGCGWFELRMSPHFWRQDSALTRNWGSRIAVRYWMPGCGLESAFKVTPMDQVRWVVFCQPRSKEAKSRQVISWAKTGVLPPRYDRQTKRSSRMEGGGNGNGEPWKVSWVGKLENWWGWGHEFNHENHPGLKMS